MDFKQFYRKISFDIDNEIRTAYQATQGDTKSRGLVVDLIVGGVRTPVTTETMNFFALKPDGTQVMTAAVKDGDKFRIDFTNQTFAVPGTLLCALVLYGTNGEKISDKKFEMMVDTNLEDGAIISKDERGILDRAFDLASDIVPRLEALDVPLLENLEQRFDNLVTTPVPTGEIIAEEIIDARDGEVSVGSKIRSVEAQLADNVADIDSRGINVEKFGAVGDFDEVTETGTDNLPAFIAARNYAKENNVNIYVPDGKFRINGFLEIFDSIVGEGVLYFHNSNDQAKMKVSSKNTPIELNPVNLGGLLEGSDTITGLSGDYTNGTLIIESSEVLIERYNPPSNTAYLKREVAIISSSEGKITPILDNTYDKSKITSIRVMPQEKQLTIGVDIRGYGSTVKNAALVLCERSNVNFENFSSLSVKGTAINTHIAISNCALIFFKNVNISHGQFSGAGYGVSVGNSAFVTFLDCHIKDCRHSLSGRHGKAVIISGGSYSGDIDTHWGSNYIINGAQVMGRITYSGKDITVENSTLNVFDHVVQTRQDTPEVYGNIRVLNNVIKSSYVGSQYLSVFSYPVIIYPETHSFGRTLRSPSSIVIEGNEIEAAADREIRLLNTSGIVGANFKVEGIDNIMIRNNPIKNRNRATVTIPYNTSVQDYQKDCRLTIENQEMNGAIGHGFANIISRSDVTNTPTWKYVITLTNCKDVSVTVDENIYRKMTITNGNLKYLARISTVLAENSDLGVWISNCHLDSVNIGLVSAKYHLVGCLIGGNFSANPAARAALKMSSGTYLTEGTSGTGIDPSVNYMNYLKSD